MSKDNNPSAQKQTNNAELKQYLRFGAMIATSMLVMYGVTYINTYQISHIEVSETRLYMTLLMGSTMAIVMLSFMLGTYKNKRVNFGIVVGSIVVFMLGTFLVRSQVAVEDTAYMKAMVPHHSIAILTSENANIQDKRVCELATEIIEAQRREINQMQWLINDISANGYATTHEEAARRSAPSFEGFAYRNCSE